MQGRGQHRLIRCFADRDVEDPRRGTMGLRTSGDRRQAAQDKRAVRARRQVVDQLPQSRGRLTAVASFPKIVRGG